MGIDFDGGLEPLMAGTGSVAGDPAPPGESVGPMRIEQGAGGISDYFLGSVEPFFRRG